MPALHQCVPKKRCFDGPAQATGPPASRRKRTRWFTRGKCGYSDPKKEVWETVLTVDGQYDVCRRIFQRGNRLEVLRRAHPTSVSFSQRVTYLHPEKEPCAIALCHNCIEQGHQIKNFWDCSPNWFPVQYSPEGGLQVVIHPFHWSIVFIKKKKKTSNQQRKCSQLPNEWRW